jgi:hypothetical protein
MKRVVVLVAAVVCGLAAPHRAGAERVAVGLARGADAKSVATAVE